MRADTNGDLCRRIPKASIRKVRAAARSLLFFFGGGGRAVGQGYEFREGILADLAVCGADFTVPLF